MESILRKIIQEELRGALLEIQTQSKTSVDSIIYDFEAGRSFGINKLMKNINGLEGYYMTSYFPRSEMEENWMFEIETNYGGSQLIEVTHKLKSDYKSYWKLNISKVERGSDTPIITNSTDFINSYDNFIIKVNSSLEKEINPNLL